MKPDDYTLGRINELELKVSNLESELEEKDFEIERLKERLHEEQTQYELARQENFR